LAHTGLLRRLARVEWAACGWPKAQRPGAAGPAARAPYFHNGGAATLNDAVEFYNQRFNLSLTPQQKADLVAFLGTL
jgi:cytochrome c peroxidase